MDEDIKFNILMVMAGIALVITYPIISMVVNDFAKDFEKGCKIRKLLVILSIIPVINILVLFVIGIRLLILDIYEEFFNSLKEIFKNVKDEL